MSPLPAGSEHEAGDKECQRCLYVKRNKARQYPKKCSCGGLIHCHYTRGMVPVGLWNCDKCDYEKAEPYGGEY